MNPDLKQKGKSVDYLYATDATRDGMWSGTWGLMRTYGSNRQDLFELPDNPRGSIQVKNQNEFKGVCPKNAPVTTYDVTAVLANDILPNNLGVTIPQLGDIDPSMGTTYGSQTNGGPLDPNGGTLVMNRRGTVVPTITAVEGGVVDTFRGGEGALNDPTAMMYVMTSDMVDPANPKAGLKPGAPVEPVVLRANAGDCIEVTLNNRLPEVAPDLAGWQDGMWVVKRRIQVDPATGGKQMHFFNFNLTRPSSMAGLHPQLVEYDMSRDDGVVVGGNNRNTVASPGGKASYRWYAGDIATEVLEERKNKTLVNIVARPVEFGAVNLLSADRVKQPMKGMFGSLVIEPKGASWTEDTLVADGQGTGDMVRKTRAQVSVDAGPAGPAGENGTYREALAIGHKITNLRWKDGTAISNIHQGELGREGAEDSGHAGFNYGAEPSWFRYKLPPDVPFGNAGTPDSFGSIANPQAMYANELVVAEPNTIPAIPGVSEAGDPATPVFRATADVAGSNPVKDTRMYVLNGASADRDGVFILHGHVWDREPYVCTGTDVDGTLTTDGSIALAGRCSPTADVPSAAFGNNLQGKAMGGQEGMGHVFSHWPVHVDAGGTGAVKGDYLYRDYTPSGNRNGQFGILRVE